MGVYKRMSFESSGPHCLHTENKTYKIENKVSSILLLFDLCKTSDLVKKNFFPIFSRSPFQPILLFH